MSRPKMSRQEYLTRFAMHQRCRSPAYVQFVKRISTMISEIGLNAGRRLDEPVTVVFLLEILTSLHSLLTKVSDNDARVACEAINELITRTEKQHELEIADGWLEKDPRS